MLYSIHSNRAVVPRVSCTESGHISQITINTASRFFERSQIFGR
jgi:hypothetical protein